MLPITHGVDRHALARAAYTMMLVLVTLLPYLTGMSGLIYLGGARSCWARVSSTTPSA
jgi:protoheme IX farnesyltransferase